MQAPSWPCFHGQNRVTAARHPMAARPVLLAPRTRLVRHASVPAAAADSASAAAPPGGSNGSSSSSSSQPAAANSGGPAGGTEAPALAPQTDAAAPLSTEAVLRMQLQMQLQMQQQMQAQMQAQMQQMAAMQQQYSKNMQRMQQQMQAMQEMLQSPAAPVDVPLSPPSSSSAAASAAHPDNSNSSTPQSVQDAVPVAAAAASMGAAAPQPAADQPTPAATAKATAPVAAASTSSKPQAKPAQPEQVQDQQQQQQQQQDAKQSAAAGSAAPSAAVPADSSSSSSSIIMEQLAKAQAMNAAVAHLLQAGQAAQPPRGDAPAAGESTPAAPTAAAAVVAEAAEAAAQAAKEAAATAAAATAAAAAAAAAPSQKQQQQQQQQLPAAAPNKQAAATNRSRPAAAAAAVADAGQKTDALLQRIERCRSFRELQTTFERQQQRLRAHHLAAIVSRLPATNEGRRALEELSAAAAATSGTSAAAVPAAAGSNSAAAAAAAAAAEEAAGSGGLSSGTVSLLDFADDLVTMLQLQLNQLNSSRLTELAQAASALQLSPRPAWVSSFLAASQPKLQHLDAAQLASLASAVAALAAASSSSSSSSRREQGPKQQQQGEAGVKVSGSWIKAWMDCSKQRLSELQATLREHEQAAAAAAAAAEAAEKGAPADGTADGVAAAEKKEKEGQPGVAAAGSTTAAAGQSKTAAAGAAAAAVSPGELIGQLALAAVELGVLSKPPAVAPSAGKGPAAGGVLPQSFGPTTAERITWVAALAAAAATAAAAVKSKALNAAAASQILHALAAQQQEQPGLLQQLDAQFRQQAGSSGSNVSYVLSIVAAVAAAAKGSMWSGGSEVLLRLLRAMMTFGVQPDDGWLTEMATCLSRQLRRLLTGDCLAAVDAYAAWCTTARHQQQEEQQQEEQQQQQQQQQEELAAAVHGLAAGLLTQMSAAAQQYSALQLCSAISSIALRLRFSPHRARAADTAALQGLNTLLQELSHAQVLADVPVRQVLALLQGLDRMRVMLEHGFTAAVQRDSLLPRLRELKPQQFAEVAQAFAGLRVQLDKEVLDGFWQETADRMDKLTDADCVALLCAMGALQQKPRSQHFGPFLQQCMPHLHGLSRNDLVAVLAAMAQLQLTTTDTQGIRATTAAAAPAPSQFIDAVLQHLTPQLPGPQGASAQQLSTVLQSLVRLDCQGVDQAWLSSSLTSAASKLSDAVAGGDVGVLVGLLSALGQLSVKAGVAAPQELLGQALGQVKAVLHQLDAGQIAVAMSALKQLQLDPDDSLMRGYLDRAAAAAAAGAATPRDMATVLQGVAAAGVVPPVEWYQQYLSAVQQQLAAADSDSLAGICHAAAALAESGRGNSSSSGGDSSSSSYEPDAGFLKDLVSVAKSRIGSNYMDAARILLSPDYRAPLSLCGLADCCWGLLKLGAAPWAVQPLVSMLISKSYDRLSQLSGSQLAGVAWAIAFSNSRSSKVSSGSSSSKKGSSGGGGGSIKLPGKWLNQLAAAAAPKVKTLHPQQLSDFVWGLGQLYLGADGYSSGTEGGAAANSSPVAAAGSSSAEPVQQLLRAVAAQVDSQSQEHTSAADDVSTLVNLLAHFDCPASSTLLHRFRAVVAGSWSQLSDAAVADAAGAMAVLSKLQGTGGSSSSRAVQGSWLEGLAEQVLQRSPTMAPQLRCKCIWALACLAYSPTPAWLSQLAESAFPPQDVTKMTPGELTDALWGLYTLQNRPQQEEAGASPVSAADPGPATAASASTPASITRGSSNSSLLTMQHMAALDRKLYKRVHELQPPQVLRLLELAEGAAEAVPGYQLPSGVGEQMSATLSARATAISDTAGVLNLAWAAASLALPLHGSAKEHICRKLYSQLGVLSASDMARGFWASAKLRYGWLPPQLEEFDRQSQAKLSGMSASDVSLLLEAFRTYGYAPSEAWLQEFAGMPAANLSSLSSSEVLQLAVQLGDPRVGLPPRGIHWLLDWAGNLDAAAVKRLSSQQLFDLVQLLAAATLNQHSSSMGSAGEAGAVGAPSKQLLGLLCWAAADAVSTASAQQVYGLIRALAGWRYMSPNGDVLLSAAAARVADKLPMLDQLQLADVVCGFADLGFTVGEPLQSKLCDRLLQASTAASTGSAGGSAATSQVDSTAAVLSAVLVSISDPPADLVPSLMQQLDGQLQQLPTELLLQLGSAFAASGMRVQGTASPAADSSKTSRAQAASTSSGINLEWGQQYLAAVGRQLQRAQLLSAQQLARLCSSLQQMGLLADEATAEAVVRALQKHLEAGNGAGSLVVLMPVLSYITESRFRPAAQGMAIVEQQLLAVLRSSSSSTNTSSVAGSTELVLEEVGSGDVGEAAAAGAPAYAVQAGAGGGQQQEEQQQQLQHVQLRPAEFVVLLKALHDWGRQPGSDLAAAAQDWSRHQLVECDVHTLGPLLLWLASTCGKPPAAWMLDWVAVSQPLLQEASAQDLVTMAVGLATAGASQSSCSPAWWKGFSAGVLQRLQGMTDEGLEVLCSSCYKLRYRPTQAWLDGVLGALQARVPDAAANTAAARALAWARQLKV